jgi:steroid 5-alpha reductase family enzyme
MVEHSAAEVHYVWFGYGALLVALQMAVLWLIGRRIHNMAVVDVGWAFSTGWLGALYCLWSEAPWERRLLGGAMALGWGLRLTYHLLGDRVLGHVEEGRYVALRAQWGAHAHRNFFLFFQAQALLVVILSTPLFLVAHNRSPSLDPREWLGAALLAVAVFGEGLADRQLARFKALPTSRGKTCRVGLWRYCRHPNYFFEWLVWSAFALLAWTAPHGWLAIGCPILMLFFLFRVTGIPATEAQALRTRGDDYRDYQRTTSAFFPWFPRSSSSAPRGPEVLK